MFDNLFDEDLQKGMIDFFTKVLAPLGCDVHYKKGEHVPLKDDGSIYIVLEGSIDQVMYSKDGQQVSFYRLTRGTIVGEMDYFEGSLPSFQAKVVSDCVLSHVKRSLVDQELLKHPELYKHFMHSIIRKCRIMMVEYANQSLNDAIGRLAHTILRLDHSSRHLSQDGSLIAIPFTHEAFASRLGMNRTTVTKSLAYLKAEGFIDVDKKHIKIMDEDGLKRLSLAIND